jgi:hypothetical protein
VAKYQFLGRNNMGYNTGPGKKETYAYEEVRGMIESCIMDRAKYLAAFYKAMPRDEFDKWAKKALWGYGERKVPRTKGEHGKVKTFSDIMLAINGVNNTCAGTNTVELINEEKAVVHFNHKCAMVQGWEDMGLAKDEVKYLCDIACYGDYAHADGLGLKCSFPYTSADGAHESCELVVEKK